MDNKLKEIKPNRLKAQDTAIEYLEETLRRVKDAGDVVGVSVVTIHKDGFCGTGWSGGDDSYCKFTMIGGIDYLKSRFIKQELDE